MTWSSVILLAIVEGLTEFLPVSSTGHMILVSALAKIPESEFLNSFLIIVQVGAILAVVSKYWTTLWKRRDYWPLLVAAFIPTSIIGYLGYSLVKSLFLGNIQITFAGLLLGGIFLLLIDRLTLSTKSLDTLSIRKASLIGLLQSLAIVPGVSRSASTIIGGQVVGLSRKAAVEFSFLLAIPVILAASGYDLLKSGLVFTSIEWLKLFIGIGISFVVARLSVDWLLSFVERRSLAIFGWYRIAIALIYFTSLWVVGR